MAEMDDVVALETIETGWGNDIRDRTLQRYDDETERDNLVPFPASGDLAWIADIQKIQVYDGTGWVTIASTDGFSMVDDIQMSGFSLFNINFLTGRGDQAFNINSGAGQVMNLDGVVTVDDDVYGTGVDNGSQTGRNILVGTDVPDNAWGKDGDIFIRFVAP